MSVKETGLIPVKLHRLLSYCSNRAIKSIHWRASYACKYILFHFFLTFCSDYYVNRLPKQRTWRHYPRIRRFPSFQMLLVLGRLVGRKLLPCMRTTPCMFGMCRISREWVDCHFSYTSLLWQWFVQESDVYCTPVIMLIALVTSQKCFAFFTKAQPTGSS